MPVSNPGLNWISIPADRLVTKICELFSWLAEFERFRSSAVARRWRPKRGAGNMRSSVKAIDVDCVVARASREIIEDSIPNESEFEESKLQSADASNLCRSRSPAEAS